MNPAHFSPGWGEHTPGDPKRALKEIERFSIECERLQCENSKVRQERDKLRREAERSDEAFRSLQAEVESERRAVRSSKAACVDAERLLDKYRQLSDAEAKKKCNVERALKNEKDRAACLERRVRKLEHAVFKARAQRDEGRLVSVIAKLVTIPAVGKRLAAAVHPDKAPAECSELATELFKFVQGVRDSNSS